MSQQLIVLMEKQPAHQQVINQLKKIRDFVATRS